MTAVLDSAPPRPDAIPVHDDRGIRTLTRDSMVFARRNIEHIRQIPEKLLDVTIQPLMFVVLFAYVFGGAVAVEGSNYREYLIGGILIQTIVFGLVGPGTAIATDLLEGVIDRFRSLPPRRVAYLLGHYIAEFAGMILAISILLGAGLLIGWRTHTGALEVVEAMALLLLFASAMIWLGTLIGLIVRTPDSVMGIAFVIIFPLTFVSNAFVPIESMPNALQWFASVNPVSVMVAAIRELFGNPTAPVTKDVWTLTHPVVSAWIMTIAMLAVFVPLTIRRYRLRTTD